jgi:hypothetical protein
MQRQGHQRPFYKPNPQTNASMSLLPSRLHSFFITGIVATANKCRLELRLGCLLLILALHPLYALTLYYDIASAQVNQRTITPIYIGDAQSALFASNLTASAGSNNPNSSDLGTGNFVFANWAGPTGDPVIAGLTSYVEFDLTAKSSLTLNSMRYTYFSGVWSDMAGPQVEWVALSKDNFTTSTVTSHGLQLTRPWEYCPNNIVDNLSGLGTINPGETVSIRFYASWSDYPFIPAGLWNKSPDNYNLTVDFTSNASAVPEPSTYAAIMSGAVLGLVALRRANHSGSRRRITAV